MAKNKGNELAIPEAKTWDIVKADPSLVGEMLTNNLGGDSISEFDFERIRFPSSGVSFFQRNTESGTEAMKEIIGVVVYAGTRRAYWEKPYGTGDGNGPPDCASMDGRVGVGSVAAKSGSNCKTCPMAQFGSAVKDGKPARGQACSQRTMLFLMEPTGLLPICVSIPPTSVGAWKKYAIALAGKGKPYQGVVTRIGLVQEKNAEGVPYVEAEFTKGEDLDEATMTKLRELSESLRGFFSAVGIDAEDRAQEATVGAT